MVSHSWIYLSASPESIGFGLSLLLFSEWKYLQRTPKRLIIEGWGYSAILASVFQPHHLSFKIINKQGEIPTLIETSVLAEGVG